MIDVRLPRLMGTRSVVAPLLEESGAPADLRGERVVVYAAELAAGSSSFADELVVELLRRRRADEVDLVGGPARFRTYLTEAAVRHGVGDKVHVRRAEEIYA